MVLARDSDQRKDDTSQQDNVLHIDGRKSLSRTLLRKSQKGYTIENTKAAKAYLGISAALYRMKKTAAAMLY